MRAWPALRLPAPPLPVGGRPAMWPRSAPVRLQDGHPGTTERPPAERDHGTSPPGEQPSRPPEAGPVCCGPDVTDWFFEEVYLHWSYGIQQHRSHGWGPFHGSTSYGDFGTYGGSLNYKLMAFQGRTCPCNCTATVTLCGTCIDRSELGNFILGFGGRCWGFFSYQIRGGIWWKAQTGNKNVGSALGQPEARACYDIGYDLANDDDLLKHMADPGAFCQYLKAHADWGKVQAPNARPCPPCAETYQGPHSRPGLPNGFPP